MLGLASTGAVAQASDHMVFLDGSATGDPKKEQWADVINNVAHTGLDASGGRLSVDVSDFMANGSKTEEQLEKLLNKWRQTNNPNPNITGLNREMVQTLAERMGLPSKGYCKDTSKSWYGRVGYHVYGGDFSRKIKEWVDLYEQHGAKIELYGYIQHVVVDKIKTQRQEQYDKFDETCVWMKNHLNPKFHDCIVWKGWHAQITTKNPDDGGKSLERGIVDIDGKILIDLEPIIKN